MYSRGKDLGAHLHLRGYWGSRVTVYLTGYDFFSKSTYSFAIRERTPNGTPWGHKCLFGAGEVIRTQAQGCGRHRELLSQRPTGRQQMSDPLCSLLEPCRRSYGS